MMHYVDLERYSYTIPSELIAQVAMEPRDSARLLVYDTKTGIISHRQVSDLVDILPHNTSIVLNTTQVLPSRLYLYKQTGGKVEVLLLLNESTNPQVMVALMNTRVSPGTILYDTTKTPILEVVSEPSRGRFGIRWIAKDDVVRYVKMFGHTPLPPYIKRNTQPKDELLARYSTVFTKTSTELYSVAAPTASLHLTTNLLDRLALTCEIIPVTLDVGMGTFGTLSEDNFATKQLHREHVSVSPQSLEVLHRSKSENRPILAVGTTVVRTLESLEYLQESTGVSGWTDLFVFPPHNFVYPTMLMTNFHVPKSSLLLLVDAFLQHKKSPHTVMDLYQVALEQKYRLFSLGDAMLIV